MKNIQVIDGADNCTYDIFAVSDEKFYVVFPDGLGFKKEFYPTKIESEMVSLPHGDDIGEGEVQ